jgi:sulfur carrier protein ThiS
MLDRIPLAEARAEAEAIKAHTEQMAEAFCADRVDEEDETIRDLLEDVSYNIMKIAVEKELNK